MIYLNSKKDFPENFVPPALNRVTKLPHEEQNRIFSYLRPAEQDSALAAIYAENSQGPVSIRNFYPQLKFMQPTNLPADLFQRVTSYLPTINAKLKGTSHTVCNQLSRSELTDLAENPLISWLIPKETLLAKRTDCREILSIQAHIIRMDEILNRSLSRNPDLGSIWKHFHPQRVFHSKPIKAFISTEEPARDHVRYIRDSSRVYSSLLFIRHMIKDSLLPKPPLKPHLLRQSERNLALFMYLQDGNIEQFNEFILHSSLYHSATSANECDEFMRSLLALAAAQNQEMTFKKLLTLQKPGKDDKLFLSDPNELLIRLTLSHIQPEYITELLDSPLAFNDVYIPNNGCNLRGSYAPGIHTALMEAATLKHLEILKAILVARAGTSIDRRILENIKNLFQPNFMDIDQYQRLNLIVKDVQRRNNNYPDPTDRNEIIALFDREIEERYPPIQAPSPELAPIPVPVAQVEQLLDNEIPQEALINDAQAQPPELPVVLNLDLMPPAADDAAEPNEPERTPSDFLDSPGSCALM